MLCSERCATFKADKAERIAASFAADEGAGAHESTLEKLPEDVQAALRAARAATAARWARERERVRRDRDRRAFARWAREPAQLAAQQRWRLALAMTRLQAEREARGKAGEDGARAARRAHAIEAEAREQLAHAEREPALPELVGATVGGLGVVAALSAPADGAPHARRTCARCS